MSLCLKITQPYARPRIIRVRSYECTVGVDDLGIVCLDPVGRAYFKLQHGISGVHFLTLTDGLEVNDAKLVQNTRRFLTPADVIKVGELQISLFLTSDYAECLAALPLSLSGFVAAAKMSHTPRNLSFSFLTLEKQIQILPGVEYTLGSGTDDSIQIELAGIVRNHGVLRVENEAIRIAPRCGDIAYNSRLLTSPLTTNNPATFFLSPSGLPINIT